MSTVQVEVDEGLLAALREANESVPAALLELSVMELYRRGAISGGKAAQVLGVSRLDFIHRAAAVGIPYFNWDQEQLEAELASVDRE
jgi:predicted HTH domain antitoxin